MIWTKDKGHSIIITGSTNGMITIWNILIESKFIKKNINGINILLPIKEFFPFSDAIVAMDIYPFWNSKYFMVCCDKIVKIYDLNTYNEPLEINSDKLKSLISSGVWPLHWNGFFIGREEANCYSKYRF